MLSPSQDPDYPDQPSTRSPRSRDRISRIAVGDIALGKQTKPWQRRLRYLYYRFIRLRSRPHAIARGLAAGVFAGFFPLFGLQTLIGIAIAIIFRGNKLVAAAGTWVSNPLTYVPIYAFNLWVGQLILQVELDDILETGLESWDEMLHTGNTFLVTLFLGCAVVGAIAAIIAYFVGLWLARVLYHQRQRRRHRHHPQQTLDSRTSDANPWDIR